MKENIIGGVGGTAMSICGTAAQTNEQLQTISIIITIIGGIITIISTCIIPLIKWYKKSKEDGKIDSDEIKEGKNLFLRLIEAIKNFFSNIKNKKGD